MENNTFNLEEFVVFTETYATEYKVLISKEELYPRFKSELHVRL